MGYILLLIFSIFKIFHNLKRDKNTIAPHPPKKIPYSIIIDPHSQMRKQGLVQTVHVGRGIDSGLSVPEPLKHESVLPTRAGRLARRRDLTWGFSGLNVCPYGTVVFVQLTLLACSVGEVDKTDRLPSVMSTVTVLRR